MLPFYEGSKRIPVLSAFCLVLGNVNYPHGGIFFFKWKHRTLTPHSTALKNKSPWGGGLGVYNPSWKRAGLLAKQRAAQTGNTSWELSPSISSGDEDFRASLLGRLCHQVHQKGSIWLQHSGGVVYIFEHNPKIWNNPFLVYIWMINLSSISKTCLMINLSSPTTHSLHHILKSNRAPCPMWFISETKAKVLWSLFLQLPCVPVTSYHWFPSLFSLESLRKMQLSILTPAPPPKDSWLEFGVLRYLFPTGGAWKDVWILTLSFPNFSPLLSHILNSLFNK